MRFSLRTVLIALVGLVAIGGLANLGVLSKVSKPEQDGGLATSGYCKTSGVSLVIDYSSDSATPTEITCVSEYQGSGWDLFEAAGAKVEGTTEYPVGFVCRINGFPTAEAQPCSSTPSATQGSWAYYYATAQLGNSWLFSATGASMRKPECGDVEAWVFIRPNEASKQPSVLPETFKCKD